MNKRIIIVLAMLSFISETSHAQLIKSYGLSLGAVNSSQEWFSSGVHLEDFHSRWGFNAGAFIEGAQLSFLNFEVELRFTQSGSVYTPPYQPQLYPDGTGPGPNAHFYSREDYLSPSILVKLNHRMPGGSLYLVAGPKLNVLVYSDPQMSFRETDLGGVFGVGFTFARILPFQTFAEFRYSPNFTYSFDDGSQTVRTHSIDFLLGVTL